MPLRTTTKTTFACTMLMLLQLFSTGAQAFVVSPSAQQQQQQHYEQQHPRSSAFRSTQASSSSSSTMLYQQQQQQQQQVLEGRKIVGEIKPVNNFVLVKTVGFKEATDEGILLAGSAKVVKTQGTVVSVGPGKTHPDTGLLFGIPLEKGDGVVYGEYDGTEINLNNEAYMLIRDDNVLVKYSGEKLTLDGVEVLGDRILVQIDDDEQSTAGGVLLASTKSNESRASTGTVVKVGEGKMAGDGTLIPVSVSVGSKVKFLDFAGNEIEIEGEEYSVVRMGEILATF